MIIGIPREIKASEHRVGLLPSGAYQLIQRGHRVVVLDDLSEGHREALFDVEMIEGSTLDTACLARVFEQYPIRAVCHFAARCYVGESVEDRWMIADVAGVDDAVHTL